MNVGEKLKEIIGKQDSQINRYMSLTILKTLVNVVDDAVDEVGDKEIIKAYDSFKAVVDKKQKQAWNAEVKQ